MLCPWIQLNILWRIGCERMKSGQSSVWSVCHKLALVFRTRHRSGDASTIRWANAAWMLVQRRRRCSNINTALAQRIVFSGTGHSRRSAVGNSGQQSAAGWSLGWYGALLQALLAEPAAEQSRPWIMTVFSPNDKDGRQYYTDVPGWPGRPFRWTRDWGRLDNLPPLIGRRGNWT